MIHKITSLFYIICFCTVISDCFIPNVNYRIRDFCIEDTGVTIAMVDNLQINPQKDFTVEESCYIHCALTETGFLSEDGYINVNMFAELKTEMSEESDIDLNCLAEMSKIEHCDEMMELRKCHV
ncbi:uncharacterized protein LOC126738529 [Anthonomus grandis grandis]|uniref:uncharacterized protein LOC126738529 n=1 Tax=Anthonomus grandis grandis TaxID=2921223 RepID=UPI00216525DA|nr:uncharacterized protein LOC126738529 [Anthonomus grandis grandis]